MPATLRHHHKSISCKPNQVVALLEADRAADPAKALKWRSNDETFLGVYREFSVILTCFDLDFEMS